MHIIHINIIGTMAATCTTIAFIPQVLKIIKTKHVRDISLQMYIILTIGIFLWLIYGLLIEAFPVILANSISVVFCAYILVMKIRHGGQ